MTIYPCYFIHLHLSFCAALNSVQYYKMAPYVFLKTFLVISVLWETSDIVNQLTQNVIIWRLMSIVNAQIRNSIFTIFSGQCALSSIIQTFFHVRILKCHGHRIAMFTMENAASFWQQPGELGLV
jgi:hypothetical protein